MRKFDAPEKPWLFVCSHEPNLYWVIFLILRNSLPQITGFLSDLSTTGGEGDNLDLVPRLDAGLGIITWINRLFVELDDHGFSGEPDGLKQFS